VTDGWDNFEKPDTTPKQLAKKSATSKSAASKSATTKSAEKGKSTTSKSAASKSATTKSEKRKAATKPGDLPSSKSAVARLRLPAALTATVSARFFVGHLLALIRGPVCRLDKVIGVDPDARCDPRVRQPFRRVRR
jgi:hypothetical protein